MPSVWYETFGRTIVEAYAAGTPVVASRLGSMEELVVPGQTGLHFEAGNAADLARTVVELCQRTDLSDMRLRARREFEDKYTAEQSYLRLMSIYERTIGRQCYDQSAHAAPVSTMVPALRSAPVNVTVRPL